MERERIEALVVREWPGWGILELVEAEGGRDGASFVVTIGRDAERRTLLVVEDPETGSERRGRAGRSVGPEDEERKSPGGPQARLAPDIEPSGS
ncbi:MAG: hypothetical protein IRZ13_02125 [Acetobacteraceae bacterium]|nr:hypothetical protein [Acetobacteraceae bacterium]